MSDIVRLVIKGESGYGCIDDAYNEKITLTRSSIRYEYRPHVESETNYFRSWSYQTNSPIYRNMFDELVALLPEVLAKEDLMGAMDIGATTFIASYADKSKAKRVFFLPGDEFANIFSIIKQMVPNAECTPSVLLTSEDYRETEEDNVGQDI